MGRQLKVATIVKPEEGDGTTTYVVFTPEDGDIPDWAAVQIGDHCFADDEAESKPTRKAPAKSTSKS